MKKWEVITIIVVTIFILGSCIYYSNKEKFENLETYVDYYIIHLEKSTDRLKIIDENNTKINEKQFKIFDAIDGNTILDKSDLSMYDPDIINTFEYIVKNALLNWWNKYGNS